MFGLRFVFAGRFSDRGECRVRRDVSVCGMPLHPMSACFYDAYWFLCFRIDLSIVWIAYNHCLRRRRARHAALTTLPRNRAVKWAHTTDTPTQDPDTRQSRRLFYLSFQADYCVDPPAIQQRTSSEASFTMALHRTPAAAPPGTQQCVGAPEAARGTCNSHDIVDDQSLKAEATLKVRN